MSLLIFVFIVFGNGESTMEIGYLRTINFITLEIVDNVSHSVPVKFLLFSGN